MWLANNWDFDLADPLLRCTPSYGYNPLNDRSLTAYMSQPIMRRTLRRHRLLTRDGYVRCSLPELQRYREYLHRCYQMMMYAKKVTTN